MTYFADKFLMVGFVFGVHLVVLWKDVHSCSILQFHLQVHNVRKTFVEVLKEKFKDYSLTFSIGGQISFDVSLVHSLLYSLLCSNGQALFRSNALWTYIPFVQPTCSLDFPVLQEKLEFLPTS
jgi:hypothetical protein